MAATPDPGVRLVPVCDRTTPDGERPWAKRPWGPDEQYIQVSADVDDLTMGLVMHEALWDIEGAEHSAEATFQAAIQHPEWQLYPGLQAIATDGTVITSSCCCSLDEWREWYDVLNGGGPWLGHTPSVGVTILDGLVVVRRWQLTPDYADDYDSPPDEIWMTPERLIQCLAEVQGTLSALSERVEAWAGALTTPELGKALAEAFRISFAVDGPREEVDGPASPV
jgi:hypothetical protein